MILINKNNIKTIAGITTNEYDSQIDLLIPQLLDNISHYCKNDFLLKSSGLYVYEQSDMTITENTITLSITLPIVAYDFFRLYGTTYNDGLYQVNNYLGGVITVESSKKLRAETPSSVIFAVVDFPSEFINILSSYIKQGIVADGTIKKEKIKDTELEYFASMTNNDFIKQNSSFLANYKKVYKENLDDVFRDSRC